MTTCDFSFHEKPESVQYDACLAIIVTIRDNFKRKNVRRVGSRI